MSSGELTYYSRSHVLGLRLRKVALVTGQLTAKRPLGARKVVLELFEAGVFYERLFR